MNLHICSAYLLLALVLTGCGGERAENKEDKNAKLLAEVQQLMLQQERMEDKKYEDQERKKHEENEKAINEFMAYVNSSPSDKKFYDKSIEILTMDGTNTHTNSMCNFTMALIAYKKEGKKKMYMQIKFNENNGNFTFSSSYEFWRKEYDEWLLSVKD